MAPPCQIPSSTQQKRKYTMLDDYVNAIQWENFTNVSAAPRLDTTPRISLQERGDLSSERSQLLSSSPSIMQRQQHISLFSLLGLPLPGSAPVFHSSETRVAPRDPSFPITGTSVPSTPMLSLSGIRVPRSDAMVPSSEICVPFSASVLSSFGPRVQSSDPMFSSPGTRVPRSDTIVSSSEISIPFGASMLPSSGTRAPYNHSMFRWSGTRVPHGDAMVPSSEVSVPMSASMLPSPEARVPYSETMFPLSGTRVSTSDPNFPFSGIRSFSDSMILPSERNVSSSPMFSSSGLRLPDSAPMFPSSQIGVPFSTSMLSLSGTSVLHSDPMFHPSGISVPYGGPIFSSPEISDQMFPSSGISAPYNATMFASSGIRAPCNVPLFPIPGMESPLHQSSQQSSPLHASPELSYSAPRMAPLLPQHGSPEVLYNAPSMASLAPQHGRVHNTPISSFTPTTINTENTQKKARIFETGSSSDQGAPISPIADQLKTVTEFSQVLNEISVPNSMADDLNEDKLLANSYTPIDSVWNTVDGNSEIDEMNNWWENSYGHDSK